MKDNFDELNFSGKPEEGETPAAQPDAAPLSGPAAEETASPAPETPVSSPDQEEPQAASYTYEYSAEDQTETAFPSAQAESAASSSAPPEPAPDAAQASASQAADPASSQSQAAGWNPPPYGGYSSSVPPYAGNAGYYTPQANQTQGYAPNGYSNPQNPYPNTAWQQTPPPPNAPSSQWTFHDYGPLGGKPPKPPKPPKVKKEKEPKAPRDKKSHSPNFGLKVFAVIISVLFVLTTAGFSGYIVYDLNRDLPADTTSQPNADDGNSTSKPQLNTESQPSTGTSLPTLSGALTGNEIYTKVEPAVVGIVGYANSTFGYQATSQGSGVIFDENGYIITNAHVITNDNTGLSYEKVEVILNDGTSHMAAIVGADSETDLAVLKIDAAGLTCAEFGDSDDARVGDPVFVIGNPNGLQFAGSMAGGFISAVNRELRVENMTKTAKYIQTDAAINPGNSGGALVNAYGQVIGITSAKLVDTTLEGMGFAIPINDAKPIVESIIENGYVAGRVKLGITYQEMSEAISQLNGIPRGIRVISFEEDSDVAQKGIQKGDIITQMDGQDVYDSETVSAALEGKKPGDTITLTIYRVDFQTGQSQTLTITAVLSEKTE